MIASDFSVADGIASGFVSTCSVLEIVVDCYRGSVIVDDFVIAF